MQLKIFLKLFLVHIFVLVSDTSSAARDAFIIRVESSLEVDARLSSDVVRRAGRGEPISLDNAIWLVNKKEELSKIVGSKRSVRIEVAAGYYRITREISLDNIGRDIPVEIVGEGLGRTIISGAKKLDEDKKLTVNSELGLSERINVYAIQPYDMRTVDSVAFGFDRAISRRVFEVYYGDKRLVVARWPNDGYALIEDVPGGKSGGVIGRLPSNAKMWAIEPQLEAVGYWFYDWAHETLPVAYADENKIAFSVLPKFGLKKGQRFYIQNALSELDVPGEYYFDRSRGLLYVYLPKIIEGGSLEYPVVETVLRIKKCKDISISGISFSHALGAVVRVEDSENVVINKSIIKHAGTLGVIIDGYSNGIIDSIITDTGEGGVVIRGGDRMSLRPGKNYVRGGEIYNVNVHSKSYRPAVRMEGVGQVVEAVTMFDLSHSAIIFSGNDHQIKKNTIYKVCLETSDSGAIYTGKDWTARGTAIDDNIIYSIRDSTGAKATRGVYLDDQASGIAVRRNFFYQVDNPVYIGGGRDNSIEDNFFYESSPAIYIDNRGQTWQKNQVDDPESVLRRGIGKVPYRSDAYRKYPNLYLLLEDSPGVAKYNVARRNVVINGVVLRNSGAENGIEVSDFFSDSDIILKRKAVEVYSDVKIDIRSNALQKGYIPNQILIDR